MLFIAVLVLGACKKKDNKSDAPESGKTRPVITLKGDRSMDVAYGTPDIEYIEYLTKKIE